MPISGPASYLPTTDEFLAHWLEVNEDLATDDGLVVADGVTRPNLVTRRDTLEGARDKVTDEAVERALAREQLNAQIVALQARLVEFNGRLRADLPEHPITRALANAFAVGDAESAVRDGLRAMARLWTKVNTLTPVPAGLTVPLLLRGEYALAALETDRVALRTAYRALTDAEVELKVAREERNDVQELIYPVLRNYRLKVPATYPPGHALVESLPALSPTGGRTPDAVVAQGVWNAATTQAKITWAASADEDLQEYQVRAVPGDDYQTEDESVLATVGPAAAREFLTGFALSAPGLVAGFKVYVILQSGHERGSEAVFVTRPAA